MRYKLIGIDLDGTLLGKDGRISAANRDAVHTAQDAGVLVAPCTGRSWIESQRALRGLDGGSVGVFVSGAFVAELATGRRLASTPLDPDTALALVRLLEDEPQAVLVFRDGREVGHDYLVTGRGEVCENTRWWFSVTDVRVAQKAQVTVEDMAHTLRVGLLAPTRRGQALRDRIGADFAGRAVVQCFGAVHMPGQRDALVVMEVFAPQVDKWHGLLEIAVMHGIAPDEIAVIGDEANDLGMMRQAGCRIAMGNASEQIKSHAQYVTLDHDQDGVAHAIAQIMEGRWG